MNRDTFMKQLAYLLQDIDDDDRQDALGYYQDYFDEAGSEHETDIINELGSPERVASIVRTSLHSNPDANGEFTDSGYENERYKDPGHELARRMDLPETPFHNKGNFYGRFSSRPNEGQKTEEDAPQADSSYRSPKKYPLLKAILWIILIIVGAPLLLGIGGGIAGVLTGIGGVLIILFIGLGLMTAAAFLSAVIMITTGIIWLFIHPLQGIFTAGAGLTALGAGFLLLALCLLFYGRLIPRLVCSIIEWISSLLHKGRCKR